MKLSFLGGNNFKVGLLSGVLLGIKIIYYLHWSEAVISGLTAIEKIVSVVKRLGNLYLVVTQVKRRNRYLKKDRIRLAAWRDYSFLDSTIWNYIYFDIL